MIVTGQNSVVSKGPGASTVRTVLALLTKALS